MISLPDGRTMVADDFESVVVLGLRMHQPAREVVSDGAELVYRGSLTVAMPFDVVYELVDDDGKYLRTFDPKHGWSHQ